MKHRLAVMLLGATMLLGAMIMLSSCTVVSCNRVFPKLTWYWTKDAQLQRESDKMQKESHERYKASQKTNTVTVEPMVFKNK